MTSMTPLLCSTAPGFAPMRRARSPSRLRHAELHRLDLAAIGGEYRKGGAAYPLGPTTIRRGRHGGVAGFIGALAER